jgi:hypothetical protein
LELPWNPAVLEQRVGRVYRLGQKRPVQVYNLVSEGGIEAHIANLVGDKKALFTGLFDGTSDELRFTSSGRFLDRVEQLVEPPQTPELPPLDEPDEAMDELPPAAVAGQPAASPAADRPRIAPQRPVGPPTTPPASGADVKQLLAGVRVECTADGGLRIEASPEAAGTLAAMFETMAKLLGAAVKSGPV